MTLGKNKQKKTKLTVAKPGKKINEPKSSKKERFPIIAICASAGGLEAFELFFNQIATKTGMAYVVITHLERDHISMLSELIKRYTPMAVLKIIDGTPILTDTIYVLPQRKNVIIEDGFLKLVDQVEPNYKNLPINYFLRSLAAYNEEKAVAVILSGAGSDGTLGARDIKLNGGLVVAQDPQSAKFDSMPSSVINMGYADYISLPAHMPEQLLRWANDSAMRNGKMSSELQYIFDIIRAKTGYDFSSYKLNTISRRIEKQMHINHTKTMAEYVMLLRQNPEEVDSLFRGFLIGVTRFFRDNEVFEILKDEILPKIFKKKPTDYCIRLWIPGCSTGEEVYSIAITIAEYMEATKHHYYVQIFGTDIDTKALDIARCGIYSDTIINDISADRLKRYFIKEKNKYRIKKEIRSMVIFGEQNLIKDPPFTKVDIISCRNLLIYLDVKLQKKILPIFHYSLKPKGILLLGMSESIAGYNDLFEFSNRKFKFFERKDAISSRRSILNFDETSHQSTLALQTFNESHLIDDNSDVNQAIKKFLFDHFMPPCVVINKHTEIVYLYGKNERYIRYSSMLENSTISNVVHYGIKTILNSGISRVIHKKKEIIYRNLTLTYENETFTINLKIMPFNDIKLLNGMLLIIFEEVIDSSIEVSPSSNSNSKSNKIISNLEKELFFTKENLQSTIEEMESSNEELQSMNEELQSTNEEIETSKEELHSLNEELVIMNTELQDRIDQLASVHDDMTNLFNSTDIATFFLDTHFCIKRFTPKAQEFIHLIPADIGRPISHFSTNIKYENLMEDAEEVLRTLNQKTTEIQTKSDRWYIMRMLPYRTLANKIDGVVITFVDITPQKLAEQKLDEANLSLKNALVCTKNIIDTVMGSLLVLSLDFKILIANRAFCKSFHQLPEDLIGKKIYELKEWNIPKLKEFLSQSFPHDVMFEGFEIEKKFEQNGFTKILFNARKIFNAEFGQDVILLAMEQR